MIPRKFEFLGDFEPGDSYKNNSYKRRNGVLQQIPHGEISTVGFTRWNFSFTKDLFSRMKQISSLCIQAGPIRFL